jgi:signal transduction histidine kinase
LSVRLNLADGAPVLPQALDEALLAVAREAMTNAVKHGEATTIEVDLQFGPETVRLRIRDNGCGFDPATPVDRGHFGLHGMRERLEAVGGRLDVRCPAGLGTDLEIQAPVRNAGRRPTRPEPV